LNRRSLGSIKRVEFPLVGDNKTLPPKLTFVAQRQIISLRKTSLLKQTTTIKRPNEVKKLVVVF
jgi:hypothetical protein